MVNFTVEVACPLDSRLALAKPPFPVSNQPDENGHTFTRRM